MKKIVLTIAITFLFCIIAHADTSVPPLINYQGMLTDADGKPMTGTKKLEFNIYDSATGGTKIWGPQIFNTVPLISGKFNVILGTTDTTGRSIVEAFGEKDRYLGIKVETGAELVPRQQILSAPYAIQAEHAKNANIAETVRGENLYVDLNDGNVGIGTTEPQSKLDVAGQIAVNGRVVVSNDGQWLGNEIGIDYDDCHTENRRIYKAKPSAIQCNEGYVVTGTHIINHNADKYVDDYQVTCCKLKVGK
ncbi:MAG: hypothetical protein DRI57_04080 [Deltaproteobacteria bacterium]|nr:MAG: hypothetical protein DRI57_04080 [Deltaproteobacteria bacterium]